MSNKYWEKREAEALEHYLEQEEDYKKHLDGIYDRTLDNIQKEIDAFYGRYAKKEGITLAEAKKRVKTTDIKEFERKAKKYVKDKNFSKQANEEMRLYNLTMKVNRLEMLKANIGLELISSFDEMDKFMESILDGRTREELERQAGILGKTIQGNHRLADHIVHASFHNATYSDRIWMYQDLLRGEIGKQLERGLIQGKNPRVLARDLNKIFNAGKYNCERLMRTELARVQIEAQRESYEAYDIEMFTFISNTGCCDKCDAIAGKHFYVKNMIPGGNAPPMHPNCRCSTAPYSDRKEFDEWLNSKTEDVKIKAKQTHNTPVSGSDEHYKKCKALFEENNVEYNPVKRRSEKMTSSDIAKTLAGWDRTDGSCASVAFAYVGQKLGFNVLDFRGGESMEVFRSWENLEYFVKMEGLKVLRAKGACSMTVGNRLLKQVEEGKEYYLCVGQHASIVRKSDGFLQYLELQADFESGEGGWRYFDKNPKHTLKSRFGCTKTSDPWHEKLDFMIDLDESEFNEDEIQSLLGFINTNIGEEKKGVGGNIK